MITNKELRVAFLNSGLPQLSDKLVKDEPLTKEDFKVVKKQIEDFDNYYLGGWKESKTRQVLKDTLNEVSSIFRWYSLFVE